MQFASIAVQAPFPWQALLDYLAIRLIPPVERIEGASYVRAVGGAEVRVEYDEPRESLIASASGKIDARDAAHRIGRLFDVRFDAAAMMRHLEASPLLAERVRRVPGMRPLGAWSPFELCVRTVLGQQVTVAAAATLMRRWMERCGEMMPQAVLSADLDNIGMPAKRVETIRTLARAVLAEDVDLDAPWMQLDSQLQRLPGFGPWTRAYLAIRLGREPDALPASDLGLIRAAQVDTPKALLQLAENWRPYRSYAATYLWAVA
jgi:3-methyladenine DNA glycosylase/8-oxoguanine DNA glycosylase